MWLLIVINMSIFHRKEFLFYYRHFSISDVGRYVFPLSLAMMGAKYLTYKSYGMIPVSLTHTVKALCSHCIPLDWEYGGYSDFPLLISHYHRCVICLCEGDRVGR